MTALELLEAALAPPTTRFAYEVDALRVRFSRVVAAATRALADGALGPAEIGAFAARLDEALPGWVREAPPAWLFAIRVVEREQFDRDAQEAYTVREEHVAGLLPAASPLLPLARTLDLTRLEEVRPALLVALAARPELLACVRGLRVGAGSVDPASLRALGRAGGQRFEQLDVMGRRAVDSRQGPPLAQAIASGFGALRALDVHAQAFGDEGAAALADAEFAPHLDELTLDVNELGDEGIARLAARLGAPRRVGLRENGIGPRGASALAPKLGQVERLVLSGNPLGDAGLAALAPALARIEDLWIADADLGDEGLAALLAADPPSLRGLWLHGNRISDAGLEALCASPLLERLRGLSLFHNPLGPTAAARLAGHPLAAALSQTARIDGWGATLTSRWPA